jgi:hypothetical protein
MLRSLAALAAMVTLGVMVGSAAAEEFRYIGDSFRVTMRALTFQTEVLGAVASCPVTLEGTFQSTFATTARARIGNVIRGTLGTCTEGRATLLSGTLPWTIQYDSVSGTLPEITSLNTRIIGAAFSAQYEGTTCLARSEEAQPAKLRFVRHVAGQLEEAAFDSSAGIRLSGGFFCELAGRASLQGSGQNRRQGSATERPIVVVNGAGTALRAPGGGALQTIEIAGAGGTATVSVVNGWNGELLTLHAAPSTDGTRFIIENTGTTCWNTIRTISSGNSCAIRIRRGTAAVNDVSPVVISYRTSFTHALLPINQAFNVRAI